MNEKMIGEKIAIARKNLNLSQVGLAKLISMSPQTISKWETGDGLPDVLMLNKLAETLKVDVTYFYNDKPFAQVEETGKSDDGKRAKFNSHKWSEIDFSKTRIEKIDLKFALFTKCNFDCADFGGNLFDFTEFKGCNMTKCNMTKCKSNRADVVDSDLSNADFSGSTLESSDFKNCNLTESKFSNAKLRKTSFKICKAVKMTIENVDFDECSFINMCFCKCVFKNTIFNVCKFKNAQFENCSADKISYNFMKVNGADVSKILICS